MNNESVSLGTWWVLKWVSCRNTKCDLSLSSHRSVERFSGTFKPLMLCEMTVGPHPKDEYAIREIEESTDADSVKQTNNR